MMNSQDLITACGNDWAAYTQHEFICQLGNGTLPAKAYLDYLQQDYLFLLHYARAYALQIYKSTSLAQMQEALPSLRGLIEQEIAHHLAYCRAQGLTQQQIEQLREAPGTIAYTRFVLDTGMADDRLALMVAQAPCGLGYGEIGQALHEQSTSGDHPYQDWLDIYCGATFQQDVHQSKVLLDSYLSDVPLHSERGQSLCRIFHTATRMEAAFWQQSLDAAKQLTQLPPSTYPRPDNKPQESA